MNGAGGSSSAAGLLLAFTMLIGGIISFTSKESKGMTITAIIFYVFGGIVGIFNVGTYADLQIWSILSFIFGGLILFHFIRNKDFYDEKPN